MCEFTEFYRAKVKTNRRLI